MGELENAVCKLIIIFYPSLIYCSRDLFNMKLELFSLVALTGIAAAFPGFGAGRPKLSLTAEPAVKPRQLSIDLAVAALNFQPPQPGES